MDPQWLLATVSLLSLTGLGCESGRQPPHQIEDTTAWLAVTPEWDGAAKREPGQPCRLRTEKGTFEGDVNSSLVVDFNGSAGPGAKCTVSLPLSRVPRILAADAHLEVVARLMSPYYSVSVSAELGSGASRMCPTGSASFPSDTSTTPRTNWNLLRLPLNTCPAKIRTKVTNVNLVVTNTSGSGAQVALSSISLDLGPDPPSEDWADCFNSWFAKMLIGGVGFLLGVLVTYFIERLLDKLCRGFGLWPRRLWGAGPYESGTIVLSTYSFTSEDEKQFMISALTALLCIYYQTSFKKGVTLVKTQPCDAKGLVVNLKVEKKGLMTGYHREGSIMTITADTPAALKEAFAVALAATTRGEAPEEVRRIKSRIPWRFGRVPTVLTITREQSPESGSTGGVP